MPPNIYISVLEALAFTNVEKLNPPDRKSAPGISADVASLPVAVVSFAHVPLPVLVSVGVKFHNSPPEAVEQEPVYTDISPTEEIEGMNAVESSLVNGKFGVMVSRKKSDGEMVADILRDSSWCCVFDSALGRKI